MAVTRIVPVVNQITLSQEQATRAAEIAELKAAIAAIPQLTASSLFQVSGNDIVTVSYLLRGHTGGALLDVNTGDIIFPDVDTGMPESVFSRTGNDIVFGAA